MPISSKNPPAHSPLFLSLSMDNFNPYAFAKAAGKFDAPGKGVVCCPFATCYLIVSTATGALLEKGE